jgi:hypothetical protein
MAELIHREFRTAGQEIGQVFTAGQEAEFVFGRGTCLFSRAPVEIYGTTDSRIVDDAGEKWFEFGFRIDTQLSGNASAGWTDAGNYFRLEPQWSPDLINWSMGKFISRPSVDRGDGTWEYWCRALNPQDSAVKTGALFASNTSQDTRVNGFTSLVIAGVAQALSNFPYDMAAGGTAAMLQTDLRTLGWTGAIVTGTTARDWTISIPSVNYTSYSQSSWVGFPMFLTEDMFGALTVQVSNQGFSGTFVDEAGTPIFRSAFARLKISAGTRYDPYP